MRPVVIIESPFRGGTGDYLAGKIYLRECIRDCIVRQGQTPYASHGLLGFFEEDIDAGAEEGPIEDERRLSIGAGIEISLDILRYIPGARVLFYGDIGSGHGVLSARKVYRDAGYECLCYDRTLPPHALEKYQRDLERARLL